MQLLKKITNLSTIILFLFNINVQAQVISTFPYVETFDGFTTCTPPPCGSCMLQNGFTNENSGLDQYDLYVGSGATPTVGTGPSDDYTGGGKYLYLESDCGGGGAAVAFSPWVDLSGIDTTVILELWYHLFGTNGTFLASIETTPGNFINLANVSSNEDNWKQLVVDLSSYKGDDSIRIIFGGMKTSGNLADVAIDQFSLHPVFPADAGISAISTSKGDVTCGGVDSVFVTLMNNGTKNLNSSIIEWSVDATMQTSLNWGGNLLPDSSLEVFLGTSTLSATSTIQAWTKDPNATTETQYVKSGTLLLGLANDTASLNLQSGLVGTYNIGGSSADFNSWTEAINSLDKGICGAVIFNVYDSTFVEQIELKSVPNASATNTITFQSASGDSSQVHLEFTPKQVPWGAPYLDLHVMLFDSGAAYYRFKHLGIRTVDGFAAEEKARTLYFYGDVQDIEFSNCFLTNGTFTSGGGDLDRLMLFDGVSSYPKNIRFYNNQFDAGFSGLMSGTIDSAFIFDQNRVNIYGQLAMDLSTSNGCDFIITNNIFPDSNLSGSIKIADNTKLTQISQNLLINQPLIIENANSFFTSNQTEIFNNVITTSKTNEYAITINNSNNISVIHNSTIGGINLTSGSNNRLLNNSFYGNKGYYSLSTFHNAISESNNNNYFVDSGIVVYVDFGFAPPLKMEFDSVIQWATYSSFDKNSGQFNPAYISKIDLNSCNTFLDNGATFINEVNTDFKGAKRDIETPDIGAYEFTTPEEARIFGAKICPNDTALLTLGGMPGSYLWSTGETDPEISALNSGEEYWVIYTGACGTITDSTTVAVLSTSPSFDIITNGLDIVLLNRTTFPGSSFVWDLGDGITSTDEDVLHEYNTPGTYIIKLTSTNACGVLTVQDTVSIFPLGIEDVNNTLLNFSVFPNPSEGRFNISFENNANAIDKAIIKVLDQFGRLIYVAEKSVQQGLNNFSFDMDVANGLYLLNIQMGSEQIKKKLVFNR